MSRAVRTTAAADRDIAAIAAYIAHDKPKSADDFEIELRDAFVRIGENAELGRVVEAKLPYDVRVIRVSQRFQNYLVFYRILGNEEVRIVRVLHGARDLNNLLRALR